MFTCLFDLSCEEDLVKDGVHLVSDNGRLSAASKSAVCSIPVRDSEVSCCALLFSLLNLLCPRIPDHPAQTRSPTHLVEREHQVQLTNILKERIQHLNKQMDSLKVRQLVIVRVDTDAKEETSITTVDDLVVPELQSATVSDPPTSTKLD